MRASGAPRGVRAPWLRSTSLGGVNPGGLMHAIFLILWFLSSGILSQPDREASVVCVDGSTQKGVIGNWASDRALELRVGGDEAKRIAIHSIDAIRISDAPVLADRSDWCVETVDGSTLSSTQIAGGGELIQVQNGLMRMVRVRLDRIRSVTRASSRDSSGKDASSTDADVVVLRNGDRVSGTIVSVSDSSLRISEDSGEEDVEIRWSGVARMSLVNQDAETTRAEWLVRLLNGDEIRAAGFQWQGEVIRLNTPSFGEISLDLKAIGVIIHDAPNRRWLSQMEPVRYESIPFFSTTWPLRVDRNAEGGPLSMAGVVYFRGVGLHAACRVTWPLDSQFRRLTGVIGVDDSAAASSGADIVIRGGSRVLYEATDVQPGEPPRRLDVDLTHVNDLTIEVNFGKGGDVGDRVDFANMRLE